LGIIISSLVVIFGLYEIIGILGLLIGIILLVIGSSISVSRINFISNKLLEFEISKESKSNSNKQFKKK
jgi:hypothetical protein